MPALETRRAFFITSIGRFDSLIDHGMMNFQNTNRNLFLKGDAMAKSFRQIVDTINSGMLLLDQYRLIASAEGNTSALGAHTGENKIFTPEELAEQLANELESIANALK